MNTPRSQLTLAAALVGTPVSKNYKVKDHFRYTGELDKVTITLTSPESDRIK